MATMVFEIEMLREMILDYAIHDDKGKVETSTVQSCRLVNKAWLQSTSKVLLKSQQPLFKFSLSCYDADADMERGAENLNQFLTSATGGARLEDRVPPHAIYVIGDDLIIKPENAKTLKTLIDCFANCGTGLVELGLATRYEHQSILQNGNIFFPNLRHFQVFISDITNPPSNIDDRTSFMQTVVNSSKQLKSFVFDTNQPRECRLKLPTSTTEISLICVPSALKMLVSNALPKLKKLQLIVTRLPLDTDATITRILQNVGKSLQNLCINKQYEVSVLNKSPATLQLPIMEKLQCLEVNTRLFELEGNPSSLQEFVPVLREMKLPNLTIPMFRKWVNNSCFDSVTSLTVSLWSLNLLECHLVNFDSDTIRALVMAFPNLEDLDVTFRRVKRERRNPVFGTLWEMKTLKRLCVFIDVVRFADSEVLEALLMGISVEHVSKLKKTPGLWEDLKDNVGPSIRNLTDLQTLSLTCRETWRVHRISDLTFNFAFFKMPKLANLIFKGGFAPSKGVKEQWIEEGRAITVNHQGSDNESSDDNSTESESESKSESESDSESVTESESD